MRRPHRIVLVCRMTAMAGGGARYHPAPVPPIARAIAGCRQTQIIGAVDQAAAFGPGQFPSVSQQNPRLVRREASS
jgi:hypothetical protein